MSELEKEPSESLHTVKERLFHFTQAGSVSDPSLNQLRDQIKKVMIPLLIKIFQLKLELSQATSSPSRLQSQKHHHSVDEITEQLKQLDKDLKMMILWCQSCQTQIQKALSSPEEDQKSSITNLASSHPNVSKSFSDAVSSQTPLFTSTKTDSPLSSEDLPAPRSQKIKKNWLVRLFKNKS